MSDLQKRIRKEAKITRSSISGKVAATYGRRYDISVSGGDYYRKVSCVNPSITLSVGDWVTMEWTGTDWQIIGYSSSVSG